MKQSIFTLLGVLISLLISPSALNAAEHSASIQWHTYDQALLKAQQQQRPIYIQFHALWCRYCKQLAEESYTLSDVQKLLNEQFVPVQILESDQKVYTLAGQPYTAQDLLITFQVTSYPTLAFLTPEGEVIGLMPSYVKPDEFQRLLTFISSKAYLNTDFDSYSKAKR